MYQFPETTSKVTFIWTIFILSKREDIMAKDVSRAAEGTRELSSHKNITSVSYIETEKFLKKL